MDLLADSIKNLKNVAFDEIEAEFKRLCDFCMKTEKALSENIALIL